MKQPLFVLLVALLPMATWRMWRLFALDTGPKCIFRRLRIRLGVEYATNDDGSVDFSRWTTSDGSLAEGICCVNCAPIWWGALLSAMLLWLSSAYLFLALALNAAAITLILQEKLYKK